MTSLDDLSWPREQLGEAIEALGGAARIVPTVRTLQVPSPPSHLDPSSLARWLETTAAWLSLEAEPTAVPLGEVSSFLRRGGPALVQVGSDAEPRYVALLRGGRRNVSVVDRARAIRRVSSDLLSRALRAPLEEALDVKIRLLLDRTVSPRRRDRAREMLLADQLSRSLIARCWFLRSPPSVSLASLAWRARIPTLFVGVVVASVLEYGLTVLSWWALGKGALAGRFDRGFVIAWLLLLISIVPARWLGAWCASRASIAAATLLKSRLLVGALRLDSSSIRNQGTGQLLGRVLESSEVETLALTGGLSSVVALVELVFAVGLLAAGTGGMVHCALLLAVVIAMAILGAHYLAQRRRWTDVRLSMTHDLVERMVGHRTRVAQEPRARWHEGEDQLLDRYMVASRALDRTTMIISAVPRAWLVCGIAALAGDLGVDSPAAVPLAIAMGGIVLANQALQTLTGSLQSIVAATISWERARPLVDAAARSEPAPPPTVAGMTDRVAVGASLLDAEEIRFRYRERGDPVLRGCSLRIRMGDRLLLEGTSGGGKSTLASVLIGVRPPESGLLLLRGLDQHAVGMVGWRRSVVSAPQFHENHMFGNTLAFNLLMGRSWPPHPRDIEEAETICRELDLGALLDRMPSGLSQVVGETGWQLSHGEKSRVYIARALLQRADMVILDESFAALDPETLKRSLECVQRRAPTLLVIAHP